MKRHQSFIPLSREHHDGLLLATRLQQGNKALLRLWSHDPHWQADYVVKFFDEHLDLHFQVEEDIVFPMAEKFFKESIQAIQQLMNEHQEMKAMVEALRKPSKRNPEKTLGHLGQVLEKHIRTEEREFFPMCEETIPRGELDRMGKLIKQRGERILK